VKSAFSRAHPFPHPGKNGDSAAFGSLFRVRAPERTASSAALAVSGRALGPRLDAARTALLSRPLTETSSPSGAARIASKRFLHSQTPFATLCRIDPDPFLKTIESAFPLLNPDCLRDDVVRFLASFFEAAGGLYRLPGGAIFALVCASAPADVEVLQLQMRKFLRRFVYAAEGPSSPSSVPAYTIRPSEEAMERFFAPRRGVPGPLTGRDP
jgi:hypothetical protein